MPYSVAALAELSFSVFLFLSCCLVLCFFFTLLQRIFRFHPSLSLSLFVSLSFALWCCYSIGFAFSFSLSLSPLILLSLLLSFTLTLSFPQTVTLFLSLSLLLFRFVSASFFSLSLIFPPPLRSLLLAGHRWFFGSPLIFIGSPVEKATVLERSRSLVTNPSADNSFTDPATVQCRHFVLS